MMSEEGRNRKRKNAIAHLRLHSTDRSTFSGSDSLFSSLGWKKSKSPTIPSSGSIAASSSQRRENRGFKPRDWLLLMVEASLSVAFKVIDGRVTQHENENLTLTTHQTGILGLHLKGYSALLSMVIGCLADSYFSYYAMALVSVAIHFVAICIYFMEEVLKVHPKGNLYDIHVRNICIAAIVLIKSTDFTRLAYGLEGMAKRKKSTIYHFIFLHFWVSSYATHGGIFVTMFSAVWDPDTTEIQDVHSTQRFPVGSLVLTGLSLFLFVYFLQPQASGNQLSGLGCRVFGCLLLATVYKMFRIHPVRSKKFLGIADGTYDKNTINRTRELLILYALLLPTLGIALSTMLDTRLFYEQLIWRLKTVESIRMIGILLMARIILSISMLFSYFGLWPLLTFMGVKNNLTVKFLFGHLLIVLSMFYMAIIFKTNENLPYSASSGWVRIFNARDGPIRLFPEGRSVATSSLLVGSKQGIMAAYPCRVRLLFPMKVLFNGTKTNYTFFINVDPGEVTGYVAVDPPEIGRIRGPFLPLREGPPGTNIPGWPRVFIYNTAAIIKEASLTIELNRKGQWKTIRVVKSRAGVMTTIALKPGTYSFGIVQARIRKFFKIQEGAFYGIIIHASTSSKELDIDEVVPPSTLLPWSFICRYIIEGLGAGIGYPTLRAIIYNNAPRGLHAMSFAFLAFLEGISFWIQFIGFKLWHYFVTGNAIFAYAVTVTSFCVLCMFVMLKYMKSNG